MKMNLTLDIDDTGPIRLDPELLIAIDQLSIKKNQTPTSFPRFRSITPPPIPYTGTDKSPYSPKAIVGQSETTPDASDEWFAENTDVKYWDELSEKKAAKTDSKIPLLVILTFFAMLSIVGLFILL